jgi:hypothetical protein
VRKNYADINLASLGITGYSIKSQISQHKILLFYSKPSSIIFEVLSIPISNTYLEIFCKYSSIIF